MPKQAPQTGASNRQASVLIETAARRSVLEGGSRALRARVNRRLKQAPQTGACKADRRSQLVGGRPQISTGLQPERFTDLVAFGITDQVAFSLPPFYMPPALFLIVTE